MAIIFDTETDGLNVLDPKIYGYAINTGDSTTFITSNDYKKKFESFLDLYNDKRVVGHNVKFDLQVLKLHKEPYELFDTMVAEWLLYPDQKKYGLKKLAKKYWNEDTATYSELINKYKPKGKKKAECCLDVVPFEDMKKYCIKDVDMTKKLFEKLQPMIDNNKYLSSIYYGVEMPFLRVLAKMELNGIFIDKQMLEEMSDKNSKRIIELRGKVMAMAGEEFNLDSPKQLSEILFTKLKIPITRIRNTGNSTDEKDLKALEKDYEIIKLLLEYRKLIKLDRTYLKSLPKFIRSDGRVHPSYNQIGTATGRISCDSPNLQNIPADELGGEIRKAFKPMKGNKFIIADYDQMELRMLANVSNDKKLIWAFNNNVDIHRLTAQLLLGKDEVTDVERKIGKTINFAIIYGQGASGLAKALEVPYAQARDFIYKYACLYSGAWTWRKEAIENSHKTMVTETIIGRKRDLTKAEGFADRLALNTPIQGSCSELVKIAMIRLHSALKDTDCLMLMQIHDELVFECPEAKAEQYSVLVQGIMDSISVLDNVILKCPMKTEVIIADSWFDK